MGATINNKSTTEPTAVEASLDILTVYRGVRDSFLSFEFRGSASVYIIPASTSTKLFSCVLCLGVIIFNAEKRLDYSESILARIGKKQPYTTQNQNKPRIFMSSLSSTCRYPSMTCPGQYTA